MASIRNCHAFSNFSTLCCPRRFTDRLRTSVSPKPPAIRMGVLVGSCAPTKPRAVEKFLILLGYKCSWPCPSNLGTRMLCLRRQEERRVDLVAVALPWHRLSSTSLPDGMRAPPTGNLLNPCLGGHPRRSLFVNATSRSANVASRAVKFAFCSANAASPSAKFIDSCSSCCRSSSFSSSIRAPLQRAPSPETIDTRV